MKKPTPRRLCTLIGIIGGVFAGIMVSGLILETTASIWGSYYYSYDTPKVMPLAGVGRELAAAMMTVGSLFFLASLAIIGVIKLIGEIRDFRHSETHNAQEIERLEERLQELEQRPDVPIEVIREKNARFSLAGILFCLVVGIIMAQSMTFLVELAFLPVVLGVLLGFQHLLSTERINPAKEISLLKRLLEAHQNLERALEVRGDLKHGMRLADEVAELIRWNRLSPRTVRRLQDFEHFADGLTQDEKTAHIGRDMKSLAGAFWSALVPDSKPRHLH